jgi:hypothetical protein
LRELLAEHEGARDLGLENDAIVTRGRLQRCLEALLAEHRLAIVP